MLRHDRLVRLPVKSIYHGGNNCGGQVAHMPHTRRLWEIGGIEEGERAVRIEIKPV